MIYAFGQYELDTRVYELRRAGAVRPVEPQVFDVLVYLVRNRDRVVSKEELLENLWPDRFVSETTLTSRLKEARKAVGDSGEKQSVIRTQRGRGYRFVATGLEGARGTAQALEAPGGRGARRRLRLRCRSPPIRPRGRSVPSSSRHARASSAGRWRWSACRRFSAARSAGNARSRSSPAKRESGKRRW